MFQNCFYVLTATNVIPCTIIDEALIPFTWKLSQQISSFDDLRFLSYDFDSEKRKQRPVDVFINPHIIIQNHMSKEAHINSLKVG